MLGADPERRANTPYNFITGQIFFKEVATTKPGNPAIALPAFYPAGKLVHEPDSGSIACLGEVQMRVFGRFTV